MLSGSATPEHSTTNLPVAKPSDPKKSPACPTRLSHGFSTLVMPVLSTNSCSLANKSALHRWHEISLFSRHERFQKKEIFSVLCLLSWWDLPTLSSLFARSPSRATCTAILQSNNTVSIFKFQDLAEVCRNQHRGIDIKQNVKKSTLPRYQCWPLQHHSPPRQPLRNNVRSRTHIGPCWKVDMFREL